LTEEPRLAPEPGSEAEPWIIDGMLPIAVAHAEAAAKAAGMTIGEWLAQLIATNTPPDLPPSRDGASSEHAGNHEAALPNPIIDPA